MPQLYDRPVWQLMRDVMVADLGMEAGRTVTRSQIIAWFAEHYPRVKKATVSAHLLLLSTNAPSRIHYGVRPGDHDLFYQLDGRTFRLYDAGQDPAPIYEAKSDPTIDPTDDIEDPDDEVDAGTRSEFAYERDLQSFLAKNLHLLEPGLSLYNDEGIIGIEYPAGGRSIDILAVDRSGRLVAIELKVSRGYDRTVGQLLRYMGYISENLAEEGQAVRGIIVAREISEDLRLATRHARGVELYEYRLSVSVSQVE